MTGVNWLVLMLALAIPIAFWFGRKVEQEKRLTRHHVSKTTQPKEN